MIPNFEEFVNEMDDPTNVLKTFLKGTEIKKTMVIGASQKNGYNVIQV